MDRSYRLYSICSRGVIVGAEGREFCSDERALARGRELLAEAHAIEVWQVHRLVRRLERSPE